MRLLFQQNRNGCGDAHLDRHRGGDGNRENRRSHRKNILLFSKYDELFSVDPEYNAGL
jgi:hypothetical protein